MAGPVIRIRRVYDPPDEEDGTRVLIDRVWPRGVSKGELAMDEWVKDVAPSTELRKWFGHDPDRFAEFRRRYRDELDGDDRRLALERLRRHHRDATLTLLTATKDPEHSHAAVLAELLRGSP